MRGTIEVVDPSAPVMAPVVARPAGRLDRLRQDEWVIGQLDCGGLVNGLADLLHIGRQIDVDWFDNPLEGSFLADPFPLGDDGLLCEEFRYAQARGVLVRHRLEGGRLVDRTVISAGAAHASYPFVVQHAGSTFVLPERSARGGVHLTRIEGPVLVDQHCLVPSVGALDPTVFRHGDRWWLFFSERAGGPMGRRLDIWSSDSLTEGWQQHPRSPIVGAPTLRPAGSVFEVDGRLYRPAQDCTRTYGGRIVLYEIEQLSATDFSERPVAALQLVGGPYTDGIHTLGIGNGRILVDGKRRRFRADALAGRVRRRLTNRRR